MNTEATIAPTCPVCGGGTTLRRAPGAPYTWTCARCGGRLLLGPAGAEGPFAGALPAAAEPGTIEPCPSCDAPLLAHRLEGRALGRCPACDLWWIAGAPPAPAPVRASGASRRWIPLSGAGLALALIVAGAAWTRSGRGGAPTPRPPPPAAPPTSVSVAPPPRPTPPPPPAAAPGKDLTPRAPIPADHLFAGRDAAWWEQRLTLLAARTDDEGRRLHDATRRRAEALGLVVTEAGGASRVEASEELASTLHDETRTARQPSPAPDATPGARP